MTTEKAQHLAHLTSMLRETEWQINRDAGSQWLANELYQRGARAPDGHSHVVPPREVSDDDAPE